MLKKPRTLLLTIFLIITVGCSNEKEANFDGEDEGFGQVIATEKRVPSDIYDIGNQEEESPYTTSLVYKAANTEQFNKNWSYSAWKKSHLVKTFRSMTTILPVFLNLRHVPMI